MNNKTFNLIVAGVGGQGLITLLQIIDEAAFIDDQDVRSSELHGLSQRGGGVEAHVRFGTKVNSPLISNGQADLVIALEMFEGLRETAKNSFNTKFLVNNYVLPFEGSLGKDEIKKQLEILGKNLYLVSASDICKEKLGSEVVSGVYLLGYAIRNNLMPLKEVSLVKAIKNIVPAKYQELNVKAAQLI